MIMTQANYLTTHPINRALLVNRILIGAGIALILISLFIFPLRNPKPEWGKFWMVQPLIITPLAGAGGGAFTYLIGLLLGKGSWKTPLAIALGIIGYIIALWLGIVLGLSGTLWN
jgi:hypothetical protein